MSSSDPWYGYAMATDEITEFLHEQATGVLSLSADDRAYGVPMSFAYDEQERRIIMDMGFARDSKKREFLETTEEACLTSYAWDRPRQWASVIAIGSLHPIDAEEIDDDMASWYRSIATDIEVADGAVELEWYALEIETLSGVAMYD